MRNLFSTLIIKSFLFYLTIYLINYALQKQTKIKKYLNFKYLKKY